MTVTRPPDAKASRTFIRRLCHDVLQRSPSPREVKVYLGASQASVITHLMRSQEAMRMWLEEDLFYFLLLDNFRPRQKSIHRIPESLKKGQMTVHDATAEILLSTSFSLRNPGNDTFVTVVLEQGLGMEVQNSKNRGVLEAGKKMYDGKRAKFLGQIGRTQSDIIKIVLGQASFSRQLLDRHHRRIFDKALPVDRRGNSPLVERLHADPKQFFSIIAEWLGSEIYTANLATKKPRNDRQFVRSLYNDLLQREPSYQELRNMRNALQSMADSSPLRAVMAKVILDSGKAKLPERKQGADAAFVTECFTRYLGRMPTQSESATYRKVLRSPDTTTEHIVRALVGSPEYQYH